MPTRHSLTHKPFLHEAKKSAMQKDPLNRSLKPNPKSESQTALHWCHN